MQKQSRRLHDEVLKVDSSLFDKKEEKYKKESARLSKKDSEIYRSFGSIIELVPNQKLKIHEYYIEKLQYIIHNLQNDGKSIEAIMLETSLDAEKLEKIMNYNLSKPIRS